MTEIVKEKTTATTPATPATTSRSFAPWADLRQEVDRLFEGFFGPAVRGTFPGGLFPRDAEPVLLSPSIDVKETDNAIVLTAELPGLGEDDVELTLRDGVLSIHGEKKTEHTDEKDNVYVSERRYGRFQRSFRLPDIIDGDKTTADFDKGVLTVTLPKRAEAVSKPRKIRIGRK